MSLCVIIGSSPGITVSSDVTRSLTALTFSNADPGGFEIASIGLIGKLPLGVRPNAEVRVMLGTEPAWHGRVNAIGEDDTEDLAAYTVECVGYGAVLSDNNNFQMVFVDRDLSKWGPPSTQRQINMQVGAFQYFGTTEVVHDIQTGFPSLAQVMEGAWPVGAQSEAYYDAGVGNLISTIYYSFKTNNVPVADANWNVSAALVSDDVAAIQDSTANLRAASGSGYFTPGTTRRYGRLKMTSGATATNAAGVKSTTFWQLSMYGTHGLTRRGTDPGGFYPGDIAAYVVGQCAGATAWSQIIGTDPLTYVCYHSVYRDPIAHQTVVDDMANLMGWHWGVWEPQGMTARQPTFYFVPRPSSPTFVLRRDSLSQLSAPKLQLDQLYSTCIVKYTDTSGVPGSVTVTVTNPFLAEAGATRNLTVDMGLGSSGEATAYGNMLLALAQASARGSGSAITPVVVESINGSYRPAALTKAGRDRVRIVDLPDAGPLDVADSRRFDTFRVKRVESTLQADGTLQTRIEFDGGADLMEVLTARLAIAGTLAGV